MATRLERAAGLAPGDTRRRTPLEAGGAARAARAPPEDVALLAELLSVPTLGRWPALDLSPQRRRERLLEALVRRVRALAARRPLLTVVEDAHWADPTTRELLDLLVARAPEMALLLVVTHRPEFDAGAWIGMHHVTPLQLNRLAPAECAALLRKVAGGKALPPEVEAEILSRTDGVPLFVEEVTRAVLEPVGLALPARDNEVAHVACRRKSQGWRSAALSLGGPRRLPWGAPHPLPEGTALVRPYAARVRANIRFRFHARVTRRHSPRTASSPRSRNCRNPSTALMMPNTGSGVCLRRA